jgi:WhiB family redox-sensing transcriptional regulator
MAPDALPGLLGHSGGMGSLPHLSFAPPPPFPQAACRASGVDPLWFFSDNRKVPRGEVRPGDQARKVCAGCPHQIPCAEYALSHRDLVGIWGGLDESDRGRLRRRKRDLSSTMAIELEPNAIEPSTGEVTLRDPDRDPLGGLYRALMAEGASIETISFRLAAETWTVTRSMNGRQTP